MNNSYGKKRKKKRREVQTETHNEPENDITELQQLHKPTSGRINIRDGHFKDNAKIRLEQNNDPVLRNLRHKILGEQYDENELTQDN